MSAYLLDTNHSSALYMGNHAHLSAKLAAHPDDDFLLALPSIGEL